MAKSETTSVNRKTEIISAAIEVFAEIGYYRATTAQVATRANISQPYIFRFFSTKEALLLAALEVSWARVIESFRKVVESASPEQLETDLIRAYSDILNSYQNEMLLQMQAQTIQEDAIREAMRHGFGEVRGMVLDAFRAAEISNPEERTLLFLARGMLCNISAALNMPELMEN
ncbi:TetR family transcriptional regulator [Brevibacillus reuszeri]|uniref:Transcriptional regulator n=1 Tax=Brevibacillus reuszeri TaxID=54915 RepID=A0A0K9YYU8_9BACL|nr:TetR/AcrR family transcriptional regulator [Brevibacillus reuszeri]KNB73405.1 transcriptional regulator [Brevibacillus reuszeri]MED1857033.1 TetR/AcrR family transcriptional regulator [Brevibacillus reuszeri]GED68212.1 TetR family transcriptional regulator [Brevibacillus reuszeri]